MAPTELLWSCLCGQVMHWLWCAVDVVRPLFCVPLCSRFLTIFYTPDHHKMESESLILMYSFFGFAVVAGLCGDGWGLVACVC
jgi:hypothetical protein